MSINILTQGLLEEKASEFVKTIMTTYLSRGESCFGSQIADPEPEIITDCLNRGFVSFRSTEKHDFVIRDAVHGSPIFLDPRTNGEITFLNLDFAKACRDKYHERCHSMGRRPQVLRIELE